MVAVAFPFFIGALIPIRKAGWCRLTLSNLRRNRLALETNM